MDELEYPEQEISPIAEEDNDKNEVDPVVPSPEPNSEAMPEIDRVSRPIETNPIRGMQFQGANFPQFQSPSDFFESSNRPIQKNPEAIAHDQRVS